VRTAESPGWRSRNRNHKGPWGPVNGIVIHHTAGRDSLRLCIEGTADLPGPLCHTHLSKAGVATLVGYGRANHAGTFAANAHNAVVAEAAIHPRPDAAEPIDGNRHYYGIEIENLGNGTDPYPEAQYDQAVRWAAAICRLHGWTAHSVIGHKEGTRRKIDPTFDMAVFRARVAERLKHPADWSPGSAATPTKPATEPPKEEGDMPSAKDIAAAVWEHPIENQFRKDSAGKPRRIAAQDFMEYGDKHHDDIVARLDRLTAAIERLTAALIKE
jgi:hypothetical protein